MYTRKFAFFFLKNYVPMHVCKDEPIPLRKLFVPPVSMLMLMVISQYLWLIIQKLLYPTTMEMSVPLPLVKQLNVPQ